MDTAYWKEALRRGGDMRSAISSGVSTVADATPRPLNTALWGNLSRGGKAISALGSNISKVGTGVLPKIGEGLKILTGPIGAGIAAAGQILSAKEANAGEDEKLRELGILPPLGTSKNKNVAPWVANPDDWSSVEGEMPNSVTPMPDVHGFATVGGKRINYSDIGNPLKDTALIGNTNTSFGVAPSNTGISGTTTQGGTNLNNILKTIQSIQPVRDYVSRINALNTGNTTWDMSGLGKILAAKAGQQADVDRYKDQLGALSNLGTAQMQSEATRFGEESKAASEAAKSAYMSPYYLSEAKRNSALAEAAPLTAKSDVLKALTEQAKENPILKASLDTLKGFADRGDAPGYNDYAMKISMLTGKLIPKMMVQE
jgi:hypothetical protein